MSPILLKTLLKKNKKTDLILHGHTHRYRLERIKNIEVFNPGESAGMIKNKNAIGLIDLKNLEIKRVFF